MQVNFIMLELHCRDQAETISPGSTSTTKKCGTIDKSFTNATNVAQV